MGALQSILITLYESILGGIQDPDWVKTGLQRGYFPLRQRWEKIHVQQVKDILRPSSSSSSSSSSVHISALSLTVGQFFAHDGGEGLPPLLEELLQLLVSRSELSVLRLSIGPSSSSSFPPTSPTTTSAAAAAGGATGTTRHHDMDHCILDTVIIKYRPSHYTRLRVEYHLDPTDVTGYWHDISQLEPENYIRRDDASPTPRLQPTTTNTTCNGFVKK